MMLPPVHDTLGHLDIEIIPKDERPTTDLYMEWVILSGGPETLAVANEVMTTRHWLMGRNPRQARKAARAVIDAIEVDHDIRARHRDTRTDDGGLCISFDVLWGLPAANARRVLR